MACRHRFKQAAGLRRFGRRAGGSGSSAVAAGSLAAALGNRRSHLCGPAFLMAPAEHCRSSKNPTSAPPPPRRRRPEASTARGAQQRTTRPPGPPAAARRGRWPSGWLGRATEEPLGRPVDCLSGRSGLQIGCGRRGTLTLDAAAALLRRAAGRSFTQRLQAQKCCDLVRHQRGTQIATAAAGGPSTGSASGKALLLWQATCSLTGGSCRGGGVCTVARHKAALPLAAAHSC